MHPGPTREEFERLYHTLDAGFRGIHDRLDAQNGRVGRGEIERAELRQRMTNIEKETFRRRRDDAGEARGLTGRDLRLIGVGLAILAAVMKLALLLTDLASTAVKAVLAK